MIIYHYSPETGVFQGEGVADRDPVDQGHWLVPAHATTQMPPQAGENEQAVWGGQDWSVETIEPPPAEPEEPEPTLDDLRAEANRLRAVSDELEAQVAAMEAESLAGFDPAADEHWNG